MNLYLVKDPTVSDVVSYERDVNMEAVIAANSPEEALVTSHTHPTLALNNVYNFHWEAPVNELNVVLIGTTESDETGVVTMLSIRAYSR